MCWIDLNCQRVKYVKSLALVIIYSRQVDGTNPCGNDQFWVTHVCSTPGVNPPVGGLGSLTMDHGAVTGRKRLDWMIRKVSTRTKTRNYGPKLGYNRQNRGLFQTKHALYDSFQHEISMNCKSSRLMCNLGPYNSGEFWISCSIETKWNELVSQYPHWLGNRRLASIGIPENASTKENCETCFGLLSSTY